MRPYMTLTKQCKGSRVSTWTFGKLSNGWFAAKSDKGQKMFFKSLEKMQSCITRYIFKYGFSSEQSSAQTVIKALASVV